MELLHRLYILLGRLVDIIVRVVKLVVLEVSCSTAIVNNASSFVGTKTYELAELREFVRSCL